MTEPVRVPIAGVGASAAGIEALEGFLRGLPDAPGLAIVVITHLTPGRASKLPEILARYTRLPVEIAVDGAEVMVNRLYVLPEDAILTIKAGRLQMTKPSANRRERKPIDIFFSGLAADLGEYAAGIVLSGGDGDGTLGIKAIKERGGLTLAQIADGYGPGYSSMPDSAIATGLVDFAIPAQDMGARLAEFAAALALMDSGHAQEQTLEQARPELYAILRNQIGHDFSGYKTRTFLRRVQRRMQVNQLATADAYIDRLRHDPKEVGALFRDLLINVKPSSVMQTRSKAWPRPSSPNCSKAAVRMTWCACGCPAAPPARRCSPSPS